MNKMSQEEFNKLNKSEKKEYIKQLIDNANPHELKSSEILRSNRDLMREVMMESLK